MRYLFKFQLKILPSLYEALTIQLKPFPSLLNYKVLTWLYLRLRTTIFKLGSNSEKWE